MNCKGPTCPKGGVKIHDTPFSTTYNPNVNTLLSSNSNPRPGSRPGLEPEPNTFSKPSQLAKPVSFQNTTMNSLDLDLEHYSLEDLYHLFNINAGHLDENSMRNAKQIVLKMHPDKSRLEAKYFLFFSSAYKRLFSIYEFQNKSTKKPSGQQYNNDDFYDTSNKRVLDNMFDKNKDLKDSGNFNSWFNSSFEKHRLEDPTSHGYGDWLKSNDDFIAVNDNVSQGNMNEVFERKKKQMQAVTVYEGVSDMHFSTFGASALDGSDMGSDSYVDLKEAYTNTLIPVSMEDYDKMQKFKNVNEYKRHRDSNTAAPLSKAEAEAALHAQQVQRDKHSAALAFKYAQEAEKVKQKQSGFWADLKQITGF